MCYRAFSRFLAARQELSEFLAQTKGLRRMTRRQEEIPPSVPLREFPLVFAPVNPLEQRRANQELDDFDTSSSDDDAKYFSLRRWLSDAIMLERFSGMRLLVHMVACILAYYASMQISNPLLNGVRSLSFLGHWRLEEPAYCDMELARFKQRITFSRLVAHD